MGIIWKLFKVVIGLAIAIPLGIIALVATVGILGTMIGLAILALKIACLALLGVGAFRLVRYMFGSKQSPPTTPHVRELSAPDPYLDAAMREVNAHLGRNP